MKIVLLLSFVCAVVACAQAKPASNDDKVVVCYYGSWAVYRNGDGKYDVEDIPNDLCTHAIYAFAGLSPYNKIIALDNNHDIALNGYTRFVSRNQLPLLAIGGYNEGSDKYSRMAADATNRKTFIDSVVSFLTSYGFKGLDIDWEYPTQRGGTPQDKENFVTLLQELRTEFDKHGFLLTIAISGGIGTIDPAYDIPKIAESVDLIHVMNFDYHGTWEGFTGINAPLYAKSGETANVDGAIQHLLQLGAPKNKLVVGIPLYGHSWTLLDPNQHGIGDSASGAGNPGPYTQQAGTLGYNEICENKNQGGWTETYDDTYAAFYTYKDNQWVGYDGVESVQAKAKYIVDQGLRGAMTWSIETDDFKAKCGTPNALLAAINKGLGR